jgi:hypothetical protein
MMMMMMIMIMMVVVMILANVIYTLTKLNILFPLLGSY